MTSPGNCGGCGIDCTGGTCQAGICALVNSPDGGVPAVGDFSCLAVDTQNVYVATGQTYPSGQIYAVPLNGGAPQTLVGNQGRPHGIASDGTNIYWTDYGSGDVMMAGTDGSNPAPLVLPGQTITSGPWDIVLDATNIYWTNSGDGTVWQAAKNGSNPHRLANGLATGALSYLTVDATGSNVYFTDRTSGNVYAAPVGGIATSIANLQGAPVGVAVDGTDLFWSNTAGGTAAGGTIVSLGLPAGNGGPTPIEHNRTNPNDLATDGTYVYWSESIAKGSINRALVTGGQITPLATQQNFPSCIAIDATSIYWIDSGSGSISKTAR